MEHAIKQIRVRARVTDLWRDDCGWSENGASVTEREFVFEADASDLAIARRIRAEFGLSADWRRDGWCSADWCWRSGAMGCYADVIDD